MTVRIITADVMEGLAQLPDESVHTVVTSPPYWGLRDYGVAGQIGLEPTPEDYVVRVVDVFREVRRVLRSDGTLWLNLGDTYAGSGRGGNPTEATSGLQGGHASQRASMVKRTRAANEIGSTARDAAVTNLARRAMRGSQLPAGFHEQARQAGVIGRAWVPPPVGFKQKDLMGMPWRVAFALQQPYHYGPIRTEADRAWLAALIDGEGTIGIKRDRGRSNGGTGECQPGYSVYVSVGNQDRELLDRCVAITGYGSVNVKDRPDVDRRGVRSRRAYYGWWISANQAVAVIRDIFPFLIAKRRQAVIAWSLNLSNKQGREIRGNGALPVSEQEKRELLKSLCNACNQRQPVDLPSWLVEPPSNVEQGWYLRSDVIWSKPNPMPESVRDRPTKSHEYVFLLAKAERYYYDAEAIRETAVADHPSGNGFKRPARQSYLNADGSPRGNDERWTDVGGARNKRSVWTIATAPFPEAHFATFPPELPEICIKAGTSEKGCCAKCGAPWRRETERETTGWSPSCDCAAGVVAATVLDPFGGAGTTGLVADRLGRDAILIELNPQYAAMAERRIRSDAPLFAEGLPLALDREGAGSGT